MQQHFVLACVTRMWHNITAIWIGKGVSLKKFKPSKHFQMQAKVFSAPESTPNDIMVAGEQALVDLYNGRIKFAPLQVFLWKGSYEHRFCSSTDPATYFGCCKISVSMYIFKYKSGKVMQVKCSQLHGDGKTGMENWCLYLQIYHLLWMSSWK